MIDGSVKEVFYTGIDHKLTVFLTNKIVYLANIKCFFPLQNSRNVVK